MFRGPNESFKKYIFDVLRRNELRGSDLNNQNVKSIPKSAYNVAAQNVIQPKHLEIC